MKYVATLADGRSVVVTLPERISFGRPVSDAEAHDAIARSVANALRGTLRPLPPSKRVTRDEHGLIDRIIEYDGASGTELAEAIGSRIAQEVLGT